MINDIKKTVEQKMQQSLAAFKLELSKVRTGRAHTSILDHVIVEYYGSDVVISQVANVTLVDARTISVQPWEKSMLAKIEKAIRESNLGLNPTSMGEIIRVPMPILTEDRRKDLIRVVRAEAENARIAIRNVRREANNEFKCLLKDKAITEDDERRSQDNIQKLTDKYTIEIDKALATKEIELMAV